MFAWVDFVTCEYALTACDHRGDFSDFSRKLQSQTQLIQPLVGSQNMVHQPTLQATANWRPSWHAMHSSATGKVFQQILVYDMHASSPGGPILNGWPHKVSNPRLRQT
jgi:hypothetical protein